MSWRFEFFPVADADPITYEVAGGVLTVNGEAFDFGPLADGDILPVSAVGNAESWLRSTEVLRDGGRIRVCVVMPFDSSATLPLHVRHPDGIMVDEDGRVPLPTDEVAE